MIYQREYRTAVSEAYSQDSPGVRFAWSHARTLARTLADAGLLADPEDERRWDDAYDWFGSELESVRGERDAAEARARRAEDALRELTEAASRLCVAVDIHPERLRPTLRREADKCRQALDWARAALSDAGQASDTTPSEADECSCARCDPGWGDGGVIPTRLSACPDCGNKRCPKGTDHDNECTGSNEPGQEGSRYA